MSSIEIYDSEGYRYDRETSTSERNDQIAEFFFGGVRLAIQTPGYQTKVVCFFRAKEITGGRDEQFYAVYQADSTQNLFRRFKADVREYVEQDLGLILYTSSDDTRVFDRIDDDIDQLTTQANLDLSAFNRKVMKSLIQRGEKLEFGARNYEIALAFVKAYINSNNSGEIAISDRGRIDALSQYDIVLEPRSGSHNALEPIGNTETLIEQERQRLQEDFISEKISNIQTEINELQQNTDLSQSQIRSRLQSNIPALRSQQLGSPGTSSNTHIKLPIIGAMGIILIIALVLVNTYFFTIPVIGGSLPFGNDGTPTLNVTHPQKDVTFDENPIFVNGTSTASQIEIRVINNETGTEVTSKKTKPEKRAGIIPFMSKSKEFSLKFELSNTGKYRIEIYAHTQESTKNELQDPDRSILIHFNDKETSPPTTTPTPQPSSNSSSKPTSPTPVQNTTIKNNSNNSNESKSAV